MKRPGQVIPGRRMKMQNIKAGHNQREPPLQSNKGNNIHLLLRHQNFVAKPQNTRREPSPLACEASALTTELTARNCA